MDKTYYIKEFYKKSIIPKDDIDNYDETRKLVFYELLENGCIVLKKLESIVGATVKESYHTYKEVYIICQDKMKEKYTNLL